MLTTKQRKNIVREAKSLIKVEVEGFDTFLIGKRESILDEYIEKACIKRNFTLAHFYNEEGKKLENILGVI